MKQYSDISKIIHKDGYIFIIGLVIATFVLSSISFQLGWISSILTVFCAYFFRNPDRITPLGEDLVISPADGIVQSITECLPPSEVGMQDTEMIKISIFLSCFDVHVNRIPCDGKVIKLHYNPGKFFNASLDKASIYNERQSVVMETTNGIKLVFVQIAGLIARRIVCDLEEGDEIKSGKRYGIIKFGSRVDVYLPLKTALCVSVGQRCVGGETIIANIALQKTSELKFEKR